MTAPVAAASRSDGLAMRFFMPAAYTRGNLPAPTDPRIAVIEVPPETLAILTYAGSQSSTRAAVHEAELRRVLDGSAWRATGPAGSFFYDPPWTLPPLRRNEVVIPVEPR
jgi:hypothetical protein